MPLEPAHAGCEGLGEGCLRIFDVSTPSAPIEAGFLEIPSWAYRVEVSEGYAYVTDSQGGLRVIDVSTPSQPFEVGSFETSDARGVALAGGRVFLTNFDSTGDLNIFGSSHDRRGSHEHPELKLT